MKGHTHIKILLLCLLSCLLPVQVVYAQSNVIVPARIVINEVQTESLTDANQEFVEVLNLSNQPVDISGWVLQYRAANGTSWSDKATLNGIIFPGGLIVISTQGYLTDIASFNWSQAGGVMSATGGNLRIMPPNAVDAEDTVAWGTGAFGETLPAEKAPKGSSIQRKIIDQVTQDTNDNSMDFEVVIPSPTNDNPAPPDPIDDPVDPIPVTDPPVGTPLDPPIDPTPPEEPIEVPPLETDPQPDPEPSPPNDGLLPPVINELLIDPAIPLTDSDDEWVELYNPNPVSFELKDYKLQTGSTFSRTHVFGDVLIAPYSFLTLYSSDTSIQLSNTSGAVRMQDSFGNEIGQAVSYDDTETANSYARGSEGIWKWTTTPTPNAENIFTETASILPVVKSTTKSTPKIPKASSPKTTSVKSSTTTKKSSTPKTNSTQMSNVLSADPKIVPKTHTLALAVFATVAVGYAIYEYREDIANRLRIARRYFATRRARRQGV